MVDFVFFFLANGGTSSLVSLCNVQISLTIVVTLRYWKFSCLYEWPAFSDGFGKFKCAFGDVNHSRTLHERVETFNACFKFYISAPKFCIFLLLLHFALKWGKKAFKTIFVVICWGFGDKRIWANQGWERIIAGLAPVGKLKRLPSLFSLFCFDVLKCGRIFAQKFVVFFPS